MKDGSSILCDESRDVGRRGVMAHLAGGPLPGPEEVS